MTKLSYSPPTVGPSGYTNTIVVSFVRVITLGILSTACVAYALFQKKLLPRYLGKIVSVIFFLPTFPLTAIFRIGNYWSQVDDSLILGCAPFGFWGHPESLYKLGVRGVVNMCFEYSGPKVSYQRLGMKQLHLPTLDHEEVSVLDLERAVEFISGYRKRGEKVYVHCKAGHGRAAAVAWAWLVSGNPNLSDKEANEYLTSVRKVRKSIYAQNTSRDFLERIRSEYKNNNNSSINNSK